MHPFSDAEVVADDFAERVLRLAAVAKPFIGYLMDVLAEANITPSLGRS